MTNVDRSGLGKCFIRPRIHAKLAKSGLLFCDGRCARTTWSDRHCYVWRQIICCLMEGYQPAVMFAVSRSTMTSVARQVGASRNQPWHRVRRSRGLMSAPSSGLPTEEAA